MELIIKKKKFMELTTGKKANFPVITLLPIKKKRKAILTHY